MMPLQVQNWRDLEKSHQHLPSITFQMLGHNLLFYSPLTSCTTNVFIKIGSHETKEKCSAWIRHEHIDRSYNSSSICSSAETLPPTCDKRVQIATFGRRIAVKSMFAELQLNFTGYFIHGPCS